jgi:membrane peptidoglycan carboxypeptidase
MYGNIELISIKKIVQTYKNDWEIIRRRIAEERIKIEDFYNDQSLNTLSNILISAEDHRYKFHFGFDIIAIFRAIRNNLLYNKSEGASTIEQQLVRTLTNNFEKNIQRKLKEILLAFSLKFIVDKKAIALIYLNIAYYGTNLDCLDKVLRKYNLKKGDFFDKEICAEIVSRLKYPEPRTNKEKRLEQILRRKNHILKLYNYHSLNKIFKIHG